MISVAMFVFVTDCRPFHPGWLLISISFGPFGLSIMSTPAILQPMICVALIAMFSSSSVRLVGVGFAPWLMLVFQFGDVLLIAAVTLFAMTNALMSVPLWGMYCCRYSTPW